MIDTIAMNITSQAFPLNPNAPLGTICVELWDGVGDGLTMGSTAPGGLSLIAAQGDTPIDEDGFGIMPGASFTFAITGDMMGRAVFSQTVFLE